MRQLNHVLALPVWIALGLLLIGLTTPILAVEKFWFFRNEVSMWSGMCALFAEDEFLLGGVILIFALLFPISKNLLLLAVLHGLAPLSRHGGRIAHWLAILGKWSMLDVFIVAIVVTSIKLGALAEAQTGNGLYFFLVSVIMTNSVSTWMDWNLRKNSDSAVCGNRDSSG